MTLPTPISYGSPEGVEVYLPQFLGNDGKFSDTTFPTIKMVQSYLADISSIMASALAKEGFERVITQVDVHAALDAMANQMAAELCRRARNSSRMTNKGKTGLDTIREQIIQWISDQAAGFENLGANREVSNLEQVAFRDTDRAGLPIAPIFERKAFNNRFKEYDSSNGSPDSGSGSGIDGTGFMQPGDRV